MSSRTQQPGRARSVLTLGLEGFGWNVSTLSLILGIVSIGLTIYIAQVQQQVQTAVQTLVPDVTITTPQNGDLVVETAPVRGTTRFVDRKLYLIVTPASNGVAWVQEGAATLHQGGVWTAMARFGEGGSGAGQNFSMYCVATAAELKPGRLQSLPPDAVVSEAVVVQRRSEP